MARTDEGSRAQVSVRQRVVAPLVRLWRRAQSPEQSWRNGLVDEEAFWANVIAAGGKNPEGFQRKLSPDSELAQRIAAFLPDGEVVRILDVGAGPLTVLGKRTPGRVLEITATDALADQFNALLDAKGLVPPVRTMQCETESLDEMFAEGSFDMTFAANTLDHHRDPIRAIDQMVRVTRVGGIVMMSHKENEAEKAHYNGLHQHNFCLDGAKPTVWNQRSRVDLDAHLAGRAEPVTAERTETDKGAGVVFLVYRRVA